MSNGWVCIHRKLLSSPVWGDATLLKIWIYLLLKANHHADKIMWNGGMVDLQSGQFITGRKVIAQETGYSESKIERALKMFEIDGKIGQQKTSKYRVVTILKWNSYQESGQQKNNKRTTKEQQKDTNNNDNKENNKTDPAAASAAKFNPLGAEVIKALEAVDPKNKGYYGNTTQRKACDFLISEYGLEEVLKRIKVLPQTNRVPFFPTITTPYQLKEKWTQLQDAVARKREEVKPKKPFVV